MAGITDTVDSLGYLNALEGFLAEQESFSPGAYSDFKQTSSGYGTRADPNEGPITEEEALRRKREHLQSEVIPHIEREFPDLTNPQKIALGSLVYNVGWDAFSSSNAYEALKSGDTDTFLTEAFDPEVGFVKAGGKPLSGLIQRRAAEAALFAQPILDGAQEQSPITAIPEQSASQDQTPPTSLTASEPTGIAATAAPERTPRPTSKSAGIAGPLQFTSSPAEAPSAPRHTTSSSIKRPIMSESVGIPALRGESRAIPRNRALDYGNSPEKFFGIANRYAG